MRFETHHGQEMALPCHSFYRCLKALTHFQMQEALQLSLAVKIPRLVHHLKIQQLIDKHKRRISTTII